jgi:hypothetical protein
VRPAQDTIRLPRLFPHEEAAGKPAFVRSAPFHSDAGRSTARDPRADPRERRGQRVPGRSAAEAQRYVAAGLREAADSEFAAGRYRLHLTSAALAASAGPWDRAVAELRQLIASPA